MWIQSERLGFEWRGALVGLGVLLMTQSVVAEPTTETSQSRRIEWVCDYGGGTALLCRGVGKSSGQANLTGLTPPDSLGSVSATSDQHDDAAVVVPLYALPFHLDDVHQLAWKVLCRASKQCEVAIVASGSGATDFGRLSGDWR